MGWVDDKKIVLSVTLVTIICLPITSTFKHQAQSRICLLFKSPKLEKHSSEIKHFKHTDLITLKVI